MTAPGVAELFFILLFGLLAVLIGVALTIHIVVLLTRTARATQSMAESLAALAEDQRGHGGGVPGPPRTWLAPGLTPEGRRAAVCPAR